MNDLPTKYDNEKHALKVGDTPHSVRYVDASSSAVQSELDAAAAACQPATASSHLLSLGGYRYERRRDTGSDGSEEPEGGRAPVVLQYQLGEWTGEPAV